MRTPQQQADTYAKVIDFLHKTSHEDDENFFELLESECQKNEINAHHCKVIMGIEAFRIGKAEARYTQMNGRQKESSDKPKKELVRVMSVRIKFEYRGQEVWYYSENYQQDKYHFENLIQFYLPEATNIRLKAMIVHRTVIELLSLETQLMLIGNGVNNYHKITL